MMHMRPGAKRVLNRLVLGTLSIGPLAIWLRPVLGVVIKVLDRLSLKLDLVHRNLPQLARLGQERAETRTLLASRYYVGLAEHVLSLPRQPLISVIVPVYKVKPAYLREALRSVTQQVYPRWELCLVDDCSNDPEVAAVIEECRAAFPGQVKTGVNPRNLHISATSNACLALATGEYVALLDHDDRLYPNALAEVVRYLNLHDGPDVLYTDECTIDEEGNRVSPVFFKPDWSPYLHLTMNYTTHLTVYRKALVDQVGGFRVGLEGSQDHDLMLRMVEAAATPVVHVPLCLYQWRAHAASTAKSQDSKPYAGLAGERAVTEHLSRRGRPAQVQFNAAMLLQRVTFALPAPPPLISVVIPSKDAFPLIDGCLRSLLERSTYQNFEIVVSDNGSTDPRVLALYDRTARQLGARFQLLMRPAPFNFARQTNAGVRAARGEYVLLLNNDTELVEPASLEELLRLAQFPDVGAVGAKLLLKNGCIQHAGVVLTPDRIAEHVGFLLPDPHPLYWNITNTVHETTAVTGACLMIATAKYWEVGGLDELYLPNAYGDIDFCLALRAKGYSNLYTPYAKLFHYESVSRRRSIEYFERFRLLQRHGGELVCDPYLNLNLRRNPRYETNPFYMDLDLNRQRFAFFLANPMDQWVALAAKLNT